MSSPLLFLCATYSLLRLPLPFLFMYCVNVICFVFFLNFRFAFSSSVSCPALRSAFRFPMLRCASYPLFWLCSAGSLLSCFSDCSCFCPSLVVSVLSSMLALFSSELCLLLVSLVRPVPFPSVVSSLLLVLCSGFLLVSSCFPLSSVCPALSSCWSRCFGYTCTISKLIR